MNLDDMKAEIARIAYWKQVTAEHDKAKALPWHLPRIPAKPEEIDRAERALGQALPAEYREFLSLANGWEGFHVFTDLFGTVELMQQGHRAINERTELQEFLAASGWLSSEVLVIGASSLELDVFLIILDRAKTLPGGVVWFAQEEVDRFGSFGEFLSAMVGYSAQVAENMQARAK
jgi:cell wall assembly regulator SMI1